MSEKCQKNVGIMSESQIRCRKMLKNVRKKVGSPNEMSKITKKVRNKVDGSNEMSNKCPINVGAMSVVQIRCQKITTTCQKFFG